MSVELVTCETVAAVALHVRLVTDIPVRLGGHSAPRPVALCGSPVDWDTQIPVASISEHRSDDAAVRPCSGCRDALPSAAGPAVAPSAEFPLGTKMCTRCRLRPAMAGRPGPYRCSECAASPAAVKQRRRAPRAGNPSRTIGIRELARDVRADAAAEADGGGPREPAPERPATRADCRDAARPCPWVGCKHHLYLDANPETGSIKINFPDLEPWELRHSCALDIAEAGAVTLEEVGVIMNLTRERIRQLEVAGLLKIKMASPSIDEVGADLLSAARAASEVPR